MHERAPNTRRQVCNIAALLSWKQMTRSSDHSYVASASSNYVLRRPCSGILQGSTDLSSHSERLMSREGFAKRWSTTIGLGNCARRNSESDFPQSLRPIVVDVNIL